MLDSQPDLHTRIGQLHHRAAAIRLALSQATVTDDVRLVLLEHLRLAEEAISFAQGEAGDATSRGAA